MSRGSLTPLTASVLAISAVVSVATARVARVHLDRETARHGADLVAVSVAAGADDETARRVAGINGTTVVSIEREHGLVTARVSRGGITMAASAAPAAVG